ncbi:MAG: hypothetical protein A2951_03025 [Candidatus Buchananbacteria bacterium RIFCSPLOWO2_01_FULL_56_15]|uniref:UDP-N-acetylmuramoyl-tripeptide--D-alanyl-D-alanine ligase n=1 Tax=Candidatus Buchananbacteria bacterium RIFCSPLOWO2_01_FULL_56_15 TaxID=1797547 RepID=A0A1G1YT66_9BACT|nr:MAG: hypothetical protein A2951_03025 [Candidatus Buchananbacteria bacterium RIFCSPLOWO2_01_FULL_56_15]
MKRLLQSLLQWKLRILAMAILRRYRPTVVAVTGSVGKTSTVEAIYTVLSASFTVRKSLKNYNNEIGIPLSIIGVESGGRSPFKWLAAFATALRLILWKSGYPKVLVLEMGADHPGDLGYLLRFVPLTIGVVTSVAPVHLEFFKTVEAVAAEKAAIVSRLPKTGTAILNYDDKLVRAMAAKIPKSSRMFGLLSKADVYATGISLNQTNQKLGGITFTLHYRGETATVALPHVIAEHLVYSALAAAAVGITLGIPLPTIAGRLKKFEPPAGRMRLIAGIKKTLIIDDSYNSSPLPAKKALWQLGKLTAKGKKVAVLGDMLELGSYAETAHQEVGAAAAEYGVGYLITVGERSRDIVRGAIEKGLSKDHCFNFPTSLEAGKFLQQQLATGDLVLIKGSQGVRMERVVKEVMARPERAVELLVRQGREWQ